MCLVLVARNAHSECPLVVLANRDEFFARPSAPCAFWSDAPGVFAGRDLEKGGTWLGVTREGRFSCVTNVRAPEARRTGLSRGSLVGDYLRGSASPRAYVEALALEAYPAFNALFGDAREVLYANDAGETRPLADGVHGISNARLDVQWPKVQRGVEGLARWLAGPMDLEDAFALLADRSPVADEELPHTGVPLEIERALAPAFVSPVALAGYGTRASTVVVFHANGDLAFAERSYGEDARLLGERRELIHTARGASPRP